MVHVTFKAGQHGVFDPTGEVGEDSRAMAVRARASLAYFMAFVPLTVEEGMSNWTNHPKQEPCHNSILNNQYVLQQYQGMDALRAFSEDVNLTFTMNTSERR
jgi:hypothetical protein